MTHGELFFSGSLEHISTDGGDSTLYRAEIGRDVDLYTAGLGVSYGDNFYFDDTVVYGWASFRPWDKLEVTVTALDFQSDTLWGVSSEYTFYQNAYAQLGYLNGAGVDDGIWDVSVGWKF